MSYPKAYRAFRRSAAPYPLSLVLSKETLPEILNAHDVVIRIHAVSVNYRDVAMLYEGHYPLTVEEGGVATSDCAAEVVALGNEVKDFVIGDHVAPTIDPSRLKDANRDSEHLELGSIGPGVLREYAVFEDQHLVKLPQYLSWEEVEIPKNRVNIE
jgi:NADPH:quinone reductase-like Zn-dependent oxidoreductase